MLTYFSGSIANFTIRTENTGSGDLYLYVQDMTTQQNIVYPIEQYQFTPYENILSFDVFFTSASVATEYRAYLMDDGGIIWNGSVQTYSSQSVNKPVYKNQNTQYVSHDSGNEFIIM